MSKVVNWVDTLSEQDRKRSRQRSNFGGSKYNEIKYSIAVNGCHECVSHKPGNNGYCRVRINSKEVRLHRYIYEFHNGPIPQGLVVMHKCDNRKCMNIDHLTIGTPRDNNVDMFKKGRGRNQNGELNHASKLSKEQVIEIRKSEKSEVELSKIYGVGRRHINDIKNRKRWAWLSDEACLSSLNSRGRRLS